MKKFKTLVATAVFLVIGVVLLIVTSYMLRPTDKNFFRARVTGFYAEEKDSLDIIAFGSSAIYRYLDNPYLWEQQGYTSYSLATAGQPIFVLEHLIEEAEKSQSPQLLVIETRKFAFTDDDEINESRLRLVTDNMKHSWNRISLINKTVPKWEDRLTYYFDLALYHENWENLSDKSLKYADNEKPNLLKGWSHVGRNKHLETPDVADITEESPISETSEKELLHIIEICKKKNIEVLFVATPWEITEVTHKKDNYIKRIVEENGCRFLDGNVYLDEIGLDYDVDFYNEKHTNSIGARKFTKFLGEYIRENYDIQSEHSQAVIDSWEKAVEEDNQQYEENVLKIMEKVEKRKNS